MPLLLVFSLAAMPLDALEAFNDTLEERFDATCAALKAGSRRAAFPRPQQIVWVTSCSLRALRLEPPSSAHLLYELEGRDADGARVIERGEADARLEKLELTDVRPTWTQVVRRAQPRFVESAERAGLVLAPRTVSADETLRGGLAVRDFDGDGRLDVVAVDGRSLALFKNRPGLTFERTLLVQGKKEVTCATAADFDADGDVDLLVTFTGDAPLVLANEGGVFKPAGKLEGAGKRTHSAIASDLDGDGRLDLAVLPYALAPANLFGADLGEQVRFYRGDGKLGFKPWPAATSAAPLRWSLAALSADLLRLGRPQLFVANDYGRNSLFVFEPDGGVRDAAKELRLDDLANGMSAEAGDVDRDGRLDLYVANMFSKAGTRVVGGATVTPEAKAMLDRLAGGNTLYVAQDDGGFVERARALNVNRGLWAFGSVLFDADDDGQLEVAVANGYYSHPNRKDL